MTKQSKDKMTVSDRVQQKLDMECLLRIQAVIRKEGFTGGPLVKAVLEQIKYVEEGGRL